MKRTIGKDRIKRIIRKRHRQAITFDIFYSIFKTIIFSVLLRQFYHLAADFTANQGRLRTSLEPFETDISGPGADLQRFPSDNTCFDDTVNIVNILYPS